jgi:hypothetical protein
MLLHMTRYPFRTLFSVIICLVVHLKQAVKTPSCDEGNTSMLRVWILPVALCHRLPDNRNNSRIRHICPIPSLDIIFFPSKGSKQTSMGFRFIQTLSGAP